MQVLIIGSGGREHALAWKCAQSEHVSLVFVAPGNAGTALEPNVQNIAIAADEIEQLLQFAQTNSIELTIVGSEAPLVLGIVDRFRQAGLRCFGPTQAAARLEGSKSFCKDFLTRHNIPTAAHQSFTELTAALGYLQEQSLPIVIKADGLAAGKGVVIAETYNEAEAAVRSMLAQGMYGVAGQKIVIEEYLAGEEASFIVMADGEHILPLATSQDHKARDDGDAGPNTGGMGAYSPAPVITPELQQRVLTEVIEPTIRGMNEDGHPYMGFLYAGLMITTDGSPKVLEFNCRLGDPETQPILMRLQSDLVELCEAALHQHLDRIQATWDDQVALGVVMTAGGYPEHYKKGLKIEGLPDPVSTETESAQQNPKVFHAGTIKKYGHIVTNGGRVLCVTALAESVQQAQQQAYERVKMINWEQVYYRNDIGHRAIAREQN